MNIVHPATGMKNGDEASPSIVLADRALLKMLITLEPRGIFGSNRVYLRFLTLSSHWHAKRDEASPSIILAGLALLVKLLISLETRGI